MLIAAQLCSRADRELAFARPRLLTAAFAAQTEGPTPGVPVAVDVVMCRGTDMVRPVPYRSSLTVISATA